MNPREQDVNSSDHNIGCSENAAVAKQDLCTNYHNRLLCVSLLKIK
jgi:hypothetical protein